jgi:hypothetical protein
VPNSTLLEELSRQLAAHQGQNPMSLTGFDVEHPLRIAALDASTGRIARLRGSPREGPESAPEPSFDCEREIAFSARHARDRHNDARLRRNRRQRSSANSRHALVDVGTLDLIERTACAVVQLQKAMLSLTPEYRWIPTSMTNAEFADVYRCVYEAEMVRTELWRPGSWRAGNRDARVARH